MLCRLIAPDWLMKEQPNLKKVQEGIFSEDQLIDFNSQGYNVYYLPNGTSHYNGGNVEGADIDLFDYVFVDCDTKDGHYLFKEDFLKALGDFPLKPTRIVDSGNGIHAYWKITDLDAKSYVKLQRRLCRQLVTDDRTGRIYQLMRLPGYINTKDPEFTKACVVLEETPVSYTCEEMDKVLPQLSHEDETYCKDHLDKTYNTVQEIAINDTIPAKFKELLNHSREVKDIWMGNVEDRSAADFRLGHLLWAAGFTKDETLSVLVNCGKAASRSPKHRESYARDIVAKVKNFEEEVKKGSLSSSVRDIRKRTGMLTGTRIPCWEVFDGTHHGFRLGDVLGLVGGAGSGKTTLALNYFFHFTKLNPQYHHMFVSLEQPEEEIAARWCVIAGENDQLHDKVRVLGNYNEDGTYRNLSLTDIENHIKEIELEHGIKIGCCVIDHIGVLKMVGKEGESQGLIDICHSMKAFAKATNTFLVMQSQTNRTKAGIGDLELDKDAAYGTTMFEWYVDALVTTWQPLKRIYGTAPHMTCSAFKYCKIRKKNVLLDKIKEDVVHVLMFDPTTERLTMMTEESEKNYDFWNDQATKIRNKDRKSEPTKITKIDWVGKTNGTNSNQDQRPSTGNAQRPTGQRVS